MFPALLPLSGHAAVSGREREPSINACARARSNSTADFFFEALVRHFSMRLSDLHNSRTEFPMLTLARPSAAVVFLNVQLYLQFRSFANGQEQ